MIKKGDYVKLTIPYIDDIDHIINTGDLYKVERVYLTSVKIEGLNKFLYLFNEIEKVYVMTAKELDKYYYSRKGRENDLER